MVQNAGNMSKMSRMQPRAPQKGRIVTGIFLIFVLLMTAVLAGCTSEDSGSDGGDFEETEDLFAHLAGMDDAELASIGQSLTGYQVPNFMRNYLYLKASQKEPFGWLYLTPSLYSIVNVDDGSFNLIPEAVYTGVENLELRVRTSLLLGDAGTEYGEKVNEWKVEFRGRYYF